MIISWTLTYNYAFLDLYLEILKGRFDVSLLSNLLNKYRRFLVNTKNRGGIIKYRFMCLNSKSLYKYSFYLKFTDEAISFGTFENNCETLYIKFDYQNAINAFSLIDNFIYDICFNSEKNYKKYKSSFKISKELLSKMSMWYKAYFHELIGKESDKQVKKEYPNEMKIYFKHGRKTLKKFKMVIPDGIKMDRKTYMHGNYAFYIDMANICIKLYNEGHVFDNYKPNISIKDKLSGSKYSIFFKFRK